MLKEIKLGRDVEAGSLEDALRKVAVDLRLELVETLDNYGATNVYTQKPSYINTSMFFREVLTKRGLEFIYDSHKVFDRIWVRSGSFLPSRLRHRILFYL